MTCNLHPKFSDVRVSKSRIIRWARHVASTGGEKKYIQGFGGET
jgi:hypothetical protein